MSFVRLNTLSLNIAIRNSRLPKNELSLPHSSISLQNVMEHIFQIPTSEVIERLIGKELYQVWNALSLLIEQKYEMEHLWNSGGKKWIYEYKYRRGGKTLCAFYAKENNFGFMVILGKEERLKFETQRESFSKEVQLAYDKATTYHDGKWIMFELKDTELFHDMEQLLQIKRKPNKKSLS